MKPGEWVPFHERIVKGQKRGIKRGVRFVLLELSLESRRTGGVLELSPNMTTLRALHDRIGGNRKEIQKAIDLFAIEPPDGEKSLLIERDGGVHRVIVVSHLDYAAHKTSTERVHEHRKNKKLASNETFHRVTHETAESLHEQRVKRSTGHDRTEQYSRGDASPLQAEPPTPPPIPEQERAAAADPERPPRFAFDLGSRVFCEEWEERYGERYVLSPNTGPRSEWSAFRELGQLGMDKMPEDPERWVRYFVRQYLEDPGDKRKLANERHPAVFMRARWNNYPAPPRKTLGEAGPAPVAPPSGVHEIAPTVPLSPEEQERRRQISDRLLATFKPGVARGGSMSSTASILGGALGKSAP